MDEFRADLVSTEIAGLLADHFSKECVPQLITTRAAFVVDVILQATVDVFSCLVLLTCLQGSIDRIQNFLCVNLREVLKLLVGKDHALDLFLMRLSLVDLMEL